MKKKEEFRKFNSDVIAMPPLTMALFDIPEPDPGKKDFRKEPLSPHTNILFQRSDLVMRLIDHLKVKE
ncbi:MAG: hypothetical protein HN855_01665 [Anaerolineae bacterium]|jgi:hypothetical protein|nr:hypothetical protein [Anaerolineae bacterium]MBT7069921.1 hypothetical protein [Anaerolineae bacterium]MBT7323848.1 hypothetical protein [Anaerolineae bacterium]